MDADLPPDAPWWARWIVANVGEAWHWASMRWPAFCAACCEVYAQYTDPINAFVASHVPKNWMPHLLAAAFVVSMLLRVLKQSKGK